MIHQENLVPEKPIYNPTYVKELFNSMSHSYERMNFIFSFGFTQIWRKSMINCLVKHPIHDKLNIIDLMTGMGETWSLTHKFFPNSSISGLDISDGMLNKAEKKNKLLFENKIDLITQDVLKNNIPSNTYDIVICAFGLKTFNSNQISILASQVRRILKPGGKFSFVEISNPRNFVLRAFYKLYLGKITPIVTWLMMGNPREYKMLWEYTKNFNNSKFVKDIFIANGLECNYTNYFFSCASGVYGKKPL